MQVTRVDVRLDPETVKHIKLGHHLADKRGIIAYCNVYFDDCFVIKEMRIVGEVDGMKVAMPDRKLAVRFSCGHKNSFDSRYCSTCGKERQRSDELNGDSRRYLDMCHPTTPEMRKHLNQAVIVAIQDRAKAETDMSQSSAS